MDKGTQVEMPLDTVLDSIIKEIGTESLSFYHPSRDFIITENSIFEVGRSQAFYSSSTQPWNRFSDNLKRDALTGCNPFPLCHINRIVGTVIIHQNDLQRKVRRLLNPQVFQRFGDPSGAVVAANNNGYTVH